jgi:peptidoglycan/xylan/chitin deacetylase (PgdA/CDA1 family)
VQCGDAVSVPPDKATIYKNVVNGVKGLGESVVLMHDLPEKKSTVEALPKIIKDLKKGNYKFLPITKNTDPVHHLVSR